MGDSIDERLEIGYLNMYDFGDKEDMKIWNDPTKSNISITKTKFRRKMSNLVEDQMGSR